MFSWFQGSIFMYMRCSNYVNICRTHSQSFDHCRTSFIMVLIQSTLGVILMITGHEATSEIVAHVSWVNNVFISSSVLCVSMQWNLHPSTCQSDQSFNLLSPSLPGLCIAQFQSIGCGLDPCIYAMYSYFLLGFLHYTNLKPKTRLSLPQYCNPFTEPIPKCILCKKM